MIAVGVGLVLTLSQNAAGYSTYGYHSYLYYRLIGYLIYFCYYVISEIAFKGRTLAKLITGTRAEKEDGTALSARGVLLRSLSRIVPFEPFSAFGGHPWHDKWTKTYVIDVKKTGLNDLLVQA